VPSARFTPLLLFAFLPVAIFRPLIYEWKALGLPADVTQYYLNPAFFDARTAMGLAIWSALAWSRAWRSPLFSALGLIAHLLLVTFVSADWVLMITPGSSSAGFGFGFGVEQVFAGLAFSALMAPRSWTPRANRDLAGMLVSALLGAMYFIYVQFVIIWYGNIPDKVAWYAARTHGPWPQLALAAFLVGAALPFLAILSPIVRREPKALRIVGALVLAGMAMHIVWLTIPAFGAKAIIPTFFAALLMASIAGAVSGLRIVGEGEAPHG
jgi:hypothetical protein